MMEQEFHIDKSSRYSEQRDLMLNVVLEHLEIGKLFWVLDLGCGLGEYLESVDAYQKYGVDLDPECIEICKQHVPEGCFYVHNVEHMPMFVNKQFDVVSAICLLEHVDDPTAMVRVVNMLQ